MLLIFHHRRSLTERTVQTNLLHFQAEGTKRGLGPGYQLKPKSQQVIAHRNWGCRGALGLWQRSHQTWHGTERSTLAYPVLLPSSLLPGPPLGQTQKEVSWQESLGDGPQGQPSVMERRAGQGWHGGKMSHLSFPKGRPLSQTKCKERSRLLSYTAFPFPPPWLSTVWVHKIIRQALR